MLKKLAWIAFWLVVLGLVLTATWRIPIMLYDLDSAIWNRPNYKDMVESQMDDGPRLLEVATPMPRPERRAENVTYQLVELAEVLREPDPEAPAIMKPYGRYFANIFRPKDGWFVGFISKRYVYPPDATVRKLDAFSGYGRKEELHLIIDNSQTVPIVEVTYSGKHEVLEFAVRLSTEELARSPCLTRGKMTNI